MLFWEGIVRDRREQSAALGSLRSDVEYFGLFDQGGSRSAGWANDRRYRGAETAVKALGGRLCGRAVDEDRVLTAGCVPDRLERK